jgi:hypothetical protein
MLPGGASAWIGRGTENASGCIAGFSSTIHPGQWHVQGLQGPSPIHWGPPNAEEVGKLYTITRVNGNGLNGKQDGVDGPHKHTLQDSDSIKKNSVVRWAMKHEKERRRNDKLREELMVSKARWYFSFSSEHQHILFQQWVEKAADVVTLPLCNCGNDAGGVTHIVIMRIRIFFFRLSTPPIDSLFYSHLYQASSTRPILRVLLQPHYLRSTHLKEFCNHGWQ